jgi:molybdate transport system substrate-binding protein
VRRLPPAALAALAALAGCGGDGSSPEATLVVSAASSLQKPLTECSQHYDGAKVRLSFAGSDELAAQIRQGVEPDVFAAANTQLPEALVAEGLL